MAPEEAAAVATLRNPQRPNPEELVARAIAPVKPEYLRPPPIRPCASDPPAEDESNVNNNGNASVERNGVKAAGSNPAVSLGKKSKRQLKRERKEEQKSVGHLCPEVAKTGDVKACKFGGGCRFSHDLDGFLQQKPVDLPGTCPFIAGEEPCPYGVACRFFGTHGEHPAPASGGLSASRKKSEVNGLSKDLQRLLWKNKVTFQKADAQLKLLGLTVGKNLKKNEEIERADANADNSKEDGGVELEPCLAENEEGPTNTCQRENSVEDAFDESESRPPKKSKLPMEEEFNDKEIEHDEIPTDINKVESETSVREDLNADFEKDNPVDDTHASRVEIVPKLNIREKKLIDFRGKLYLAPLTTVGNLPFRRVCKVLGADITCGEMAMCTNLLQGQASEWALLRRHSSEDLFGVQICGAYPDTVSRTVELIDRECDVDFVDINMGCPIDIVVNKGAGSSLLTKPMRMKNIIQAACGTIDKPLTVKVRTGYFEGRNRIDSLIADISHCGASAITIHGRSRQQRYSKLADWDYVYQCARKAPNELQVLGNGDIFSYVDWNKHTSDCPKLSTCMIARAALVKPWIFTEIKEQRHWDITSGERLDILKKYANFGLQHWGSDSKGVETTRHFLLEWLSYTYRYIPVGLLDVIPQRLNWRPPSYFGRDDLETLMASDSAADWIRISEMLLGKVPEGFTFAPKHKSNAYDRAENG